MKIINTLYSFKPLNKVIVTLSIFFISACSTTSIIPKTPAQARDNFRVTHSNDNIQNSGINDASLEQLIAHINANKTHLPSSNNAHNRTHNGRAKNAYSQKLSPGDKIELVIPEGEEFNGIYTIELDGTLRLPYLSEIVATGSSTKELAQRILDSLVLEGIFRADFIQVSVNAVQWAPIHIVVRGAIYNPGNILINKRNHQENFNPVVSRTGDFADKRLLSSALKAAGGLKPTADIRHIKLIRSGEVSVFDMSGLLNGSPVIDPPLAAGDQLVIPSLSYLQEALLRPSSVTPPGFRVYLSNLTIPADSNNKSSNNKFASSLPPGSRLLTGAMSANCVGGTISVNAQRHILLAGKDPLTNKIRVMERSLKELLANPNMDSVNPYLMPEDSVACYDSGVTNARDIARSVADFLRPFVLISGGAL